MSDLIVLVADNDMEQTVRGLLETRRNSLQITDLDYEINRHPYRDSGCYSSADEFLRPFINKFEYAMVIFDHHGSGHENVDRGDVEGEVENNLNRNGWSDRNSVITISPELENWVWVESNELGPLLGWNDNTIEFEDWLQKNIERNELQKPINPKETLEQVLKITKKPRSARIYRDIAETVTLHNCRDESFIKFRTTLSEWFEE